MTHPRLQAASFLLYLGHERQYSPHTVEAYRRALELALEAMEGRPWGEVTRQDVRALVSRLDARYAPSTVRQRVSALRSFYGFLRRNEHVETNPVTGVRGPKLRTRLPTYLTRDQMEDVFGHLEAAVEERKRCAVRNRALVEVAYSGGLRLAELTGLDTSDLDLSGRVARVTGKGRKERLVPLGRPAVEAVSGYLERRETRRGPLWLSERGNRLSRRQTQRVAAGALNAVEGVKDATAHSIRHTTATHLVAGGASLPAVAAILGHESVTTTARYVQTSVQRLKAVYQKAHPRA